MKVKVIKLDERYVETRTKQEEQYIGEIREAFELYIDWEEDGYKKQYALNMGNGVWFLPVDCCEVIEE